MTAARMRASRGGSSCMARQDTPPVPSPAMGGRARGLAAASVLAVVLGGCAVDAGTAPSPSPSSVAPAASPSAGADCPPVRSPTPGTSFDQDLHDELMAMLERDQAGRLGTGQDDEGDQARTDRLMEI